MMSVDGLRCISGIVCLSVSICLALPACADRDDSIGFEPMPAAWSIPAEFPPLPQPTDNLLSAAAVELGRRLFYDSLLSLDGSVACANCHRQQQAFSDGLPVSRGIDNEPAYRNAPTLVNTAYASDAGWDGASGSLEEQILKAITNPAEMRMDTVSLVHRLRERRPYPLQFQRAYPGSSGITASNAVKALAGFVRTIVSGQSAYDRFHRGERSVLSHSALRGMALFFNNRTNCHSCHSGFNFTDRRFHNTGLYFRYDDLGRYYLTGRESDRSTFRTPTLRNVALTAPYMHDGSKASLREVLDHYNSGGVFHKNKDTLIKALGLGPAELDDLETFLYALSDDTLLENPLLARPD